MRRILLTTMASLAAAGAVVNDARAQNAAQTSAQSGASYSTYVGGSALPTASAPQPGTAIVRLNGRFRFYAYEANDRNASTDSVGSGGIASKQDSYGFAEFARLYPGFDGVASNGFKYGASLEIRQDAVAPAGGGVNGSVNGQDPKRGELYYRRIWGYLGTNGLGTVRLGAVDQPTSLYLTGNFENFNDGGWNGDVPSFFAGNDQPAWPFSDIGSYYTTSKAVYLSPQLFGFDLGVSYEPSTANVSAYDNCNYPGGPFTTSFGQATTAYCDRASSSANVAESARRRNTFDMLLRYRGAFGPVGVALTGAYITGSHVDYNGGLPYTNNPLAATGQTPKFRGLNIGDFGAAVTLAGVSIGGHYDTGRFNGTVANTLAAGVPNGNAWLVGASYSIGPIVVGASYFVTESAGDLGNAYFGRQRKEQGFAGGGTYALAPGLSIFLSTLWGERKQNGYNFITGAGVTSATGSAGQAVGNKVTVSGAALGTAFAW